MANYIQSMDASLVRAIVARVRVIPVHDCFLVEYFCVTQLICEVNEAMNCAFHELTDPAFRVFKIRSVFILL